MTSASTQLGAGINYKRIYTYSARTQPCLLRTSHPFNVLVDQFASRSTVESIALVVLFVNLTLTTYDILPPLLMRNVLNTLLTINTTNAIMYTVDREANWSTSTLRGWDRNSVESLAYICGMVDSRTKAGRVLGCREPRVMAGRMSVDAPYQPFRIYISSLVKTL